MGLHPASSFWDPSRSGLGWQRLWLLALCLPLLVVGLGLRDPWPPDEPRFALLGLDLLQGAWDGIIPRINGEVYAHKPPLFFWLQALGQYLAGPRIGFLLPSLIAALVVLLLVHDLAHRLYGRRVAWWAGLALLCSLQFLAQARVAQIDMVLCAWTTLAIYGLSRRLLLDGAPVWWLTAFLAMGLGIITKGVGVLPLLLLPLWWMTRRPGWRGVAGTPAAWEWLAGLGMLILGLLPWIGPLLWRILILDDPATISYLRSIGLGQTVGRMTAPKDHREPFWYYVGPEGLPILWLPLVLLLPWLAGSLRRRLQRKDGRLAIFLGGCLLIVAFFSCLPGKRGVYLLPALPLLVLALAPLLGPFLGRAGVHAVIRTTLLGLTGLLLAFLLLLIHLSGTTWIPALTELIKAYGYDPLLWLAVAILGLGGCAWLAHHRAVAGLVATMAVLTTLAGLVAYPRLDPERSARSFMRQVEADLLPHEALGILPIKTKEQFLLFASRPVTTFGYEDNANLEALTRARKWLGAGPDRCLLLGVDLFQGQAKPLDPVFDGCRSQQIGLRHRKAWLLVRAPAPP